MKNLTRPASDTVPDALLTEASDGAHAAFDTVARAIAYLRLNARRQPGLGEVAAAVGLSEYHLQRLFSDWAGISPKRFVQYLTKEYAIRALRESRDVLDATLASGLSGPGRLHDLLVTCEAMTPGEIKRRGAGLDIGFGTAPTPFGGALLAWTGRGLCHLEFIDASPADQARLAARWPQARLHEDAAEAGRRAAAIFAGGDGRGRLHLLLSGSNFQIKVWEALLRIPPGRRISYGDLAALIGAPHAARAVGSAVAANVIAYLIPCHRVIREGGDLNQYRWGVTRKAALLAWEAAQADGR